MADLSLFDLSGKKALVTGGSRGIGRACAIALAMGGADVAIVGRNEELGRKTLGTITTMGGNAVFMRCDVSKAEQVEDAVQSIVRQFGRLDIAVNNAGIFRQGDDESVAKESWDQVIGVNLTGTWLCARAQMRQMIRNNPAEGKIINIASITGSIAGRSGSYGASKAGVIQLTKILAAQWGRYNINVNSLSPGYVVAAMGATRSLKERRRLRDMTPLGHVQRLEDLYGATIFLASRASNYITGQNLIVDGGHTLSTWVLPLERSVPARVDEAGEIEGINKYLTEIGVAHDEDGMLLE